MNERTVVVGCPGAGDEDVRACREIYTNAKNFVFASRSEEIGFYAAFHKYQDASTSPTNTVTSVRGTQQSAVKKPVIAEIGAQSKFGKTVKVRSYPQEGVQSLHFQQIAAYVCKHGRYSMKGWVVGRDTRIW